MRQKIIVPVRKKRGPPRGNVNQKYPAELRATQFALEQAIKRLGAVEKQGDALAKLDKQKDITINFLTNRVRTLEQRITRRDSE